MLKVVEAQGWSMGIYIILHTFQILQNLLKEEVSTANGPLVEP